MTAGPFPKAEEAIWLLSATGIELEREGLLARFTEYQSLCSTWNLSAKLMSPTDLRERFDEHVADCLSLIPYLHGQFVRHSDSTLVDIGAGGGLPGLVVALAMPGLPVWEVERSETKCLFLRQAAARLGLSLVQVIQGNFPAIKRPSGPIIYTARATEASATVDLAIVEKLRMGDLFIAQREVSHIGGMPGVVTREAADAFAAAGLRRGVLNLVSR